MALQDINHRFLDFIGDEPQFLSSFGQKIAQVVMDFKGSSSSIIAVKNSFEFVNLAFSPYNFFCGLQDLYQGGYENKPKPLVLRQICKLSLNAGDILKAISLYTCVNTAGLLRHVRFGASILGLVRLGIDGYELQGKISCCYAGWSQYTAQKKQKKVQKILQRTWMVSLSGTLALSGVAGPLLGIALPAYAINLIALGLLLPKLKSLFTPKVVSN